MQWQVGIFERWNFAPGVDRLSDGQTLLRRAHGCHTGAPAKRFTPTVARLAFEAWLDLKMHSLFRIERNFVKSKRQEARSTGIALATLSSQ